jgi:hypothetical protein
MFSFFKRKKKKELVSVIEPTVAPHMKPLTEKEANKFRSDVKSKGIVHPASRENYSRSSYSSTDSSDDLINTIVAVGIANSITDSSNSYSSDYSSSSYDSSSSSCDSGSSSCDSGSW